MTLEQEAALASLRARLALLDPSPKRTLVVARVDVETLLLAVVEARAEVARVTQLSLLPKEVTA